MTPANKQVEELRQRFGKIRNNPYVLADFSDWPEEFGDDDEFDWEDDELYRKAHQWARRLARVAGEVYESKSKDQDLHRVLINVFLVPAKIVYASWDDRIELEPIEEDIENEISLYGYNLCLTFLQRVRKSLIRLIEKQVSPIGEWRTALLKADEIALEVKGRIIELAKRLREE